MAEYIDIDAPIDVAVYQRNRRIQVTLRQILKSNDAKYERADVRPAVRGKWTHRKSKLYTMCSACGYGYSNSHYHEVEKFKFCPNCGAMMEASDGKD